MNFGMPLTLAPVAFVALLMGLFIPQLALLSGEPHVKATPKVNTEERSLGSSASESRPAFHAGRRVSTHLAYWLVPVVALLIGVVLSASAIGTSASAPLIPVRTASPISRMPILDGRPGSAAISIWTSGHASFSR